MLFSAQQFIIASLGVLVKAQILRFRPCRADFLRLSNAGAGGRILSIGKQKGRYLCKI